MITVETRGRKNETKSFTREDEARAYVVDRQIASDCAVIKFTKNGRSTFFEFNNGAWEAR